MTRTFGQHSVVREVVRYRYELLQEFASAIFTSLGLCCEDAAMAAAVLIAADLRGVDSHGVAHLHPTDHFYVGGLRTGTLNPRGHLETIHETSISLLLDGDRSLGMVAGVKAMRRTIEKARDSGVCLTALRNAGHYGMAGYYAMMALEHDMIGMSMTNTAPIMLPTFGRQPMLGTDPIAFAVPAGMERALVLDMATTTVSGGKVEVAAREGKPLPLGWATGPDGQPITDAALALQRLWLTPLGGTAEQGSYKGYGLATIVEIIAGLLSGAGASFMLKDSMRGHFFAAFRIDLFQRPNEFKVHMDEFLRGLKATPPVDGADRVLVAGQREFEIDAERRANGVPLHPEVVATLKEVADQQGIPWPL